MIRNIILSRDLTQVPDTPAAPAPRPILQTADELFPALDQFCITNGFSSNWPARMLDAGAQAILISEGATPAAAGWLIRKPFYLEEIRRTLDPGPDADYLFGDFVAPAFRGRHLQRALIQQRLQLSREAARRSAMAMTRDNNPASLKSYIAAGFLRAAELRSSHMFHLQFDRLVRHLPTLRPNLLSPAGLPLACGLSLRRR